MKNPIFAASPGLRRRVLLSIYMLVLVAAASTTAVCVAVAVCDKRVGFSDRVGIIGDVFAGGTLFLALVAGLIALQAYAAATGLPSLRFQLQFSYSDKNRPVFRGSVDDDGRMRSVGPQGQTVARVLVSNTGAYSARNPAIVIRLNSVLFDPPESASGWLSIESVEIDQVVAVQWDGGASYSIHGRSVRRLPDLNLGRLACLPDGGDPSITVEMLAEGGYRREIVVPIQFIASDGFGTVVRRAKENQRIKNWI